MALLFMDGMDNYSADSDITDRWDTVAATGGTNWTVQTTGGVDGGGALQCQDDDIDLVKRIREAGTTGEDEIRIAFWFKSSSAPGGDDQLFAIWEADSDEGTSNLQCEVTSSGTLQFTAYGSILNVSGSETTTNVCDGTWRFLEFHIVIADTGTLKILVDGVAEVDSTSVDTYVSGTISTNVIVFTGPQTDMTIDDIIIWDDNAGDSFTGELGSVYRIETLRPNGNGDSSQWVGSDADSTDNYQLIDETARDTSDYVGSGTDGNADLYAFGNMSATVSSIKAAVVSGHVALDGAGAEGFRLNAKSSSTTTNGSDKVSEGVSYALYQQAFTLDPATTAAWTQSGIDSAQFGIEKRST